MNTDLYAVLGLDRDASDKEIAKKYKKLARENHPDVNPGDPEAEERFKAISAAYDVLGDPDKRAEYDQFRSMVGSGFSGGGFSGGGFSGGGVGGGVDLNDLIGQMFTDRNQRDPGGFGFTSRNAAYRGSDLSAAVTLDFGEAVRGTELSLQGPDGPVTVRVPAGIDHGQALRVPGKGSAGVNGGPDGDLIVEVRVNPDSRFGRRGSDLTIEVPVTFAEATLGATVAVRTFDGAAVKIKVPEGTPTGRTFRVAGRGIQTATVKGDLLVTVTVEVPADLSEAQRAALEAYAEVSSVIAHPNRI